MVITLIMATIKTYSTRNFLSNFFYDKSIQLDLKTLAIPFERIDLTNKLRNEFERKIVFFKTVYWKYYLYYGNYTCQSPTPLVITLIMATIKTYSTSACPLLFFIIQITYYRYKYYTLN